MCEVNANNTLKVTRITICNKDFRLYYMDEGNITDLEKHGLIAGMLGRERSIGKKPLCQEKLKLWNELYNQCKWKNACIKLANRLKNENKFEDSASNICIPVPSSRKDIKNDLINAIHEVFEKVKVLPNLLSKDNSVKFGDIGNKEKIKSKLKISPDNHDYNEIRKVLIIDDFYASGETMKAVGEKLLDSGLFDHQVTLVFAVPGKFNVDSQYKYNKEATQNILDEMKRNV